MLQGYGDTVLRDEALEKELDKARKHSVLLQSKLDGAFRPVPQCGAGDASEER
jgi:hypothetical protein